MIVYFGAPRTWEVKILREEGATHILTSFADREFHSVMAAAEGLEAMVDSGAYSAWSRGAEVNVEGYAAVIEKYQPSEYINLDVIGNREQTDINQDYLEGRGLHPIPVYHAGESMEILSRLAGKYKRIGIGGLVELRQRDRQKANTLVQQITNDYPNIKFHGFGIGSLEPEHMGLYSVDSTTWISAARFNRQIGRQQTIRCEGAGLFWSRTELLRHNIRALLWQQDNVKPYKYRQEGLF